MGHLTKSISEDGVRTIFARYGEVTSLELKSGTSKVPGYAFVYFRDRESVDRVMSVEAKDYLHRTYSKMDVNRIRSEKQLQASQLFSPDKIFFAGFENSISRLRIHKFFETFGSLENLILLQKKQSKQYGYVTSRSEKSPSSSSRPNKSTTKKS